MNNNFKEKNEGTPTGGSPAVAETSETALAGGRAGRDSMLQKIKIVDGNQSDYFALARLHYQPILKFPPTKVFKAVGLPPYDKGIPDPAAVIVFTQPFPEITARTNATAGFFHQHESLIDNLRLVNKHVLYLARLITDTRILRRGVATLLLNEALSRTSAPVVETLTPIDFTNSMYQKAGFELYPTPPSIKHGRIMSAFSRIGLTITETTSPELIEGRLRNISTDQRQFIEKEIAVFLSGFRNADRFKPSRERTNFILSKIPPPAVYLIWFNPNSDEAKKILNYRQTC